MSISRIESIIERLRRSANVRSVFGDPIERGDRTVVPVARVGYVFGGGYGRGESSDGTGAGGQGGGGGGGAAARPVGALEITDEGTRFVRVGGPGRSLALLFVGLVVGLLLARRSDEE